MAEDCSAVLELCFGSWVWRCVPLLLPTFRVSLIPVMFANQLFLFPMLCKPENQDVAAEISWLKPCRIPSVLCDAMTPQACGPETSQGSALLYLLSISPRPIGDSCRGLRHAALFCAHSSSAVCTFMECMHVHRVLPGSERHTATCIGRLKW